ncbi:MAG: rhomboid family intramembrane serine protease [Candidatus Obscuribacterales bacterium]|nr:rhomboid family intramembrane serine protease [Candidatus Obscuribacterales bacterium]
MIPLRDNLNCRGDALLTYLLIGLNCFAFLIELMVPESAAGAFMYTWAVVPAKITAALASGEPILIAMAVVSIFSAMFLHGGIMHILGNMIFLQAFGRAVENRLGKVWFLLFYLAGGFAAWGFHYYTDPASKIPALGASGCIAAVLGGYLLFYPKAKFRTLLMIGPLPLLATIRAYWFLIIWFGSQLLPGIAGMISPASSGVAYWAHIGGFIAGIGMAALWATCFPESDVCYAPNNCVYNGLNISLWNPFRKERDRDFDGGHGSDTGSGINGASPESNETPANTDQTSAQADEKKENE